MVFESVAAHLIDKYLGDYIQNLDAKKLKIDLWNGKNEFFLYPNSCILFIVRQRCSRKSLSQIGRTGKFV